MTREEEIIKASYRYAKHQQKPFVDGAKLADKTIIDIQYCGVRRNGRTFNGLLKIKVTNPACALYKAMEE